MLHMLEIIQQDYSLEGLRATFCFDHLKSTFSNDLKIENTTLTCQLDKKSTWQEKKQPHKSE